MKKEFENILKKLSKKIKSFCYIKGTGKILNKIIALNILFLSKDNEEITLLYQSEYNLE